MGSGMQTVDDPSGLDLAVSGGWMSSSGGGGTGPLIGARLVVEVRHSHIRIMGRDRANTTIERSEIRV